MKKSYCTSCDESLSLWDRFRGRTMCGHCIKYPLKDGDHVLIEVDQNGNKTIVITVYLYVGGDGVSFEVNKIPTIQCHKVIVCCFNQYGMLNSCDNGYGYYITKHAEFAVKKELVRICREVLQSLNISTEWIDHGDKNELP